MTVGKLYTVARASQLEFLQVPGFRDFVILGVNLAWKMQVSAQRESTMHILKIAVPALATCLVTGSAMAAPFTAIRIGDADGFGFGAAALFSAANGGPANLGSGGVLTAEPLPTIGDFLPDLNGDGTTQTGSRDDFDNRSAAEVGGSSLNGQGFTNVGTTGSQFTDISLSTSYDTSNTANDVFDANTGTRGAGGPFPAPPSGALTNQPGFVFDFSVASADITTGTPIFFNMLFGDYDVVPALLQFTRSDGSTFNAAVTTQNNAAGQDGLIQAAFATLNFTDVFSATGGGWNGRIDVDFVANNEPYTAFDFVELSVTPIDITAAEPATLAVLGLGLVGLAFARRKKAA